MRIDTTKIPNFDNLPDDVKAAITGMEFADAPDMSQFVSKATFDKKASEAADLSKQLRARMSEDELAKAQAAEERAAMMQELEILRTEKVVTENTNKFLGLGYDEKLAKDTAIALNKGEMDIVFKNHAKFIESREKALRAEILKETPSPAAGNGENKLNRTDFAKMTLAEKTKFAQENPEQFNELYGGK